MRTAILCSCGRDDSKGRWLAEFLERNCAVRVSLEEGRIRPGFDLIEAAATAISADVAIVLLSPDSVPPVWARERWEPVFLEEAGSFGTRVAFVLLQDCKFPALFRRRHFFDAAADAEGARRRLKRWLLGGNPLRVGVPESAEAADGAAELAALETRLADQPGIASGLSVETALGFASAFAEDFEGVLRFDCADRTRAGLLGDVSDALGLRLTQRMEKNREALGRFCEERRLLLIFDRLEGADREFVSPGGLASVIFTHEGGTARGALSFDETLELFTGWVRNEEACLQALGAAQRGLRSEASLAARMQLGWATTVFLRHRERLAEAYEILDWMRGWLEEQGDVMELHRVHWEQSWILEHWGEAVLASAPRPEPSDAMQMVLDW